MNEIDINISSSNASDILNILKYVKRNNLLKDPSKSFSLDKIIIDLSNKIPKTPKKEYEVPLIMRLEDYGRAFKGMVGDVPVIFDNVKSSSRWYFYIANNEFDLSYNSLWQNKHYPSLEQCINQAESWLELNA